MYKNVVIAGDLNYDFAQRYGDLVTSTTERKLQTSLLQFDYTVVDNEPTSVTPKTPLQVRPCYYKQGWAYQEDT